MERMLENRIEHLENLKKRDADNFYDMKLDELQDDLIKALDELRGL